MECHRSAVTVVIADRHAAYRDMLARTIEADPRFELLAVAKDGVEALDAAWMLEPQVLICDVRLGQISGLELARCLRRSESTTNVVVHTAIEPETWASDPAFAIADAITSKFDPLELCLARFAECGHVSPRRTLLSTRQVSHLADWRPASLTARRSAA